jgi:hypothetical protein
MEESGAQTHLFLSLSSIRIRPPLQHALINTIHNSCIWHDPHQMSTQAAIEGAGTLLCNDESKSLNETGVFEFA